MQLQIWFTNIYLLNIPLATASVTSLNLLLSTNQLNNLRRNLYGGKTICLQIYDIYKHFTNTLQCSTYSFVRYVLSFYFHVLPSLYPYISIYGKEGTFSLISLLTITSWHSIMRAFLMNNYISIVYVIKHGVCIDYPRSIYRIG